jgi:hypothetical protein
MGRPAACGIWRPTACGRTAWQTRADGSVRARVAGTVQARRAAWPAAGALRWRGVSRQARAAGGVRARTAHQLPPPRRREPPRRSLTFFLNPWLDCPVVPPSKLLAIDDRLRAYPDFTWREFLEFTQKQYWSDSSNFINRRTRAKRLCRKRPPHIDLFLRCLLSTRQEQFQHQKNRGYKIGQETKKFPSYRQTRRSHSAR